MKVSYIILFAACFSVYLASCTKDKAEEITEWHDSTCTHYGQDTMSYINHIVPILTTNCTNPSFGDCHFPGSVATVDLTNYAAVKFEIELSNFDFYVLDPNTASMPRINTMGPTELTECDKERLQLWIDQGYPDN